MYLAHNDYIYEINNYGAKIHNVHSDSFYLICLLTGVEGIIYETFGSDKDRRTAGTKIIDEVFGGNRRSGGSCKVTCLDSSCQVRTGGTMGSCFLPPFPTKCSGLPSGCRSCVNECSRCKQRDAKFNYNFWTPELANDY